MSKFYRSTNHLKRAAGQFLLPISTLDRSLWVTRSICKYMLERWHSHFSTKELSMQYYLKGKKSKNLVWQAWQFLRLKKFSHKLHLLANKPFCKSPKPSTVKRRSRKNTQYQPCQASYTQTFRVPLLSAVLSRKRTTMIGNLLMREQGFDHTLWGHFFVLQAITG